MTNNPPKLIEMIEKHNRETLKRIKETQDFIDSMKEKEDD